MSTVSFPQFGSFNDNNLKIFLPAVAPFIEIWNALPSCLSGKKKSTPVKTKNNTNVGIEKGKKVICEVVAKAIEIPIPAPPYATRSMIVVEASCIVKTFIVIFLNVSASSTIFFSYISSALKIFNSFIPEMLSKNASPICVYSSQYVANIFFAYLLTAIIEIGINGTAIKSAIAL